MRKIFKSGETPLLPILFVCMLLFLTSCGNSQESEEENALIYAALNPVTKELENSIESFNKTHPDTPIEVHDYSDEGGPKRLMTELVLGKVPDIMELQRLGQQDFPARARAEVFWFASPFEADTSTVYWMPYRQLAQRGYLEDLWPYIENDPSLGRERIVEAPLKAAEVNGGLYMLFKEVSVNTLMGAESVVGDRISWTLEELLEAFSAMPEGSAVLRYETTRYDAFSNLIAPVLDQFIDWENGECTFDSQEFREMLGFLSLFPSEVNTWLSSSQIEQENTWRQLEGLQMLEPARIDSLSAFMYWSAAFGEPAVPVGYPTAGGGPGASFILHGNKLAMSSACRNKEAAWDFMARMLYPESKSHSYYREKQAHQLIRMPVNRMAFQLCIQSNMPPMVQHESIRLTFWGGPELKINIPTEEDLRHFEELVNSTTQIYWPDTSLSNAVWDTIAPYFAGDRTMEEVIDLVQRRVQLYVNEQR